MSTFWIAAGALTLFVVAALAASMLVRRRAASPPRADASNVALYRDQLAELERDRAHGILSDEQFEQARTELAQRLLADVPPQPAEEDAAQPPSRGVWRFVALAAIPIVAVLGYLVLGVPDAIEGRPPVQSAAGGAAGHAGDLAQLVERLAARLEQDPRDAEAWVLLARSRQMLGQPAEAVKAIAKAIELEPRIAPLWADYADMIVAAANGEWTGAAKDALARSLALDPAQPKALWLAGSEAFTRRDYAGALAHWEKLPPLVEQGSEVAQMIAANIAEARTLFAGGGKPPQDAPRPADGAPVAAAAAPADKTRAVHGIVQLDPRIAGRVEPADTVFVFARAHEGPKMPLAIRRIAVKDLPYRFTLDDSAAMAPGMVISAFDQVVIGARVSRSGDAAPKPGDFQGLSAPVKPGTGDIRVTIDAEIR